MLRCALISVLPVGHTRTFEPRWLVMGADLVHAATAAVWLGGLVALILHLASARRRGGDPADSAVILGRFSTLAGGLVLLLGVTGTILGVVIVGSLPALVGSTYGRLLLAKLAVVAVIGALAAWNRFGLVPRLAREQFRGRAWDRLSLGNPPGDGGTRTGSRTDVSPDASESWGERHLSRVGLDCGCGE